MEHPLKQETDLKKMGTAHNHEEEKMRVLYEASYKGCVATFNTLIHQDPLILHRINSRTILIETPLHISALLGHLEFTKTLLTRKPKLALELDSFRSTPLHLASAEGHMDIVKELLLACDLACLVPDQEGRIPLHYAIVRGRLEVITELIRAKPESVMIWDKGKTIFHLCVMYNHLEVLKALVESDIDGAYKLLNERDMDGKNTILHLAVMLKQVETVRYLLSNRAIRDVSNLENHMGYTVHDILQRIPQDFKSLEIQVILMNSGFESDQKRVINTPEAPITTNVIGHEMRPRKKCWISALKCLEKWFMYNGDYLEEIRGNLSLVATVISTITFQPAINPPGSFVQQGILVSSDSTYNDHDNTISIERGPLGCLPFKYDDGHNGVACPGEAMLAFRNREDFRNFIVFNTISFIASLCVALLLISGAPLKNRVVMWMLSLGMCVTIMSLAEAYFYGLSLMTPFHLWDSQTDKVFVIAAYVWDGLLSLVGVYIISHFFIWAVKIIKHRISIGPRSRDGNNCCFI